MKDDIRVNGYPVVIDVTYQTEPGEGWTGSTHAGGPFYSTDELNDALPEIIRKKPDYWNVHIEFQDRNVVDGTCIAGDNCTCDELERTVCFDWKQQE